MKPLTTFNVILLLVLVTGCSAFRSSQQTLTVQVTDPPHAKIWVNRVCAGEAPVQVSVLRNRYVDVTAEKDGFHAETRTIRYHLNATGYLDIAGAWLFIIPVIGIMTPGHDSLDETTITMRLSPETEAEAAAKAAVQPAADNNTEQEKATNSAPF